MHYGNRRVYFAIQQVRKFLEYDFISTLFTGITRCTRAAQALHKCLSVKLDKGV
jgi:hypothetical protein